MQVDEVALDGPAPSLTHRETGHGAGYHLHVGLDVHKDTIAVALAEAGKRGELREHGKIAVTRRWR